MTWCDGFTGYVNTFGGASEWVFGRLCYRPLQGGLQAPIVVRNAAQRDFEACWPICPYGKRCAQVGRCARATRRELVIRAARSALARRV